MRRKNRWGLRVELGKEELEVMSSGTAGGHGTAAVEMLNIPWSLLCAGHNSGCFMLINPPENNMRRIP